MERFNDSELAKTIAVSISLKQRRHEKRKVRKYNQYSKEGIEETGKENSAFK